MVEVMRRGEVWVANLNPNKGGEIGKIRPVLILQDNHLTAQGLTTVLAAPLTTQLRREFEPIRVLIKTRDRLLADSHVMPEHTRAIDRKRIGEGPLTTLTKEEMAAVERSLLAVLGMY